MSTTTRRRWRRGAAFASLAMAASLSLPLAPAYAADGIDIDHSEVAKGKGTLLMGVTLPTGVDIDLDSIAVTVDGEETASRAEASTGGSVDRTTVVVLDASRSMEKDGRMEAAQAALGTFLDTIPSDVAVGLVTFAGKVREPVAPTTDHEQVRAAVDTMEVRGGTAVNDAIVKGIDVAGSEGARSLLVLSDGADVSSSATLDEAVTAAEESGIVVDVVDLDDEQLLAPLTTATSGQLLPTDPASLTTVFADQANALARQVVVTYDIPGGAGDSATVAVTASAGGSEYSDQALLPLTAGQGEATPATAPEVKVAEAGGLPPVVLLAGAGALFLGLVVLLFIALGGQSRSKATSVVDNYLAGPAATDAKSKKRGERGSLKDAATQAASKVVKGDFESRVHGKLQGAGFALTPSEWILLHVGIAVLAAVVMALLGGAPLAVLGLILGAIGPYLYLNMKHKKRLAKFEEMLAETLGLMAGGLQAGLSMPQAIDTVVQEGQEPMASELKRALVEQRLGIDIADALESVGHRMESKDFSWVVMAIRIQREVGGNLAEVLETVAVTLRERSYLRGQVRALSAEGRMSGYILTALPILVAIATSVLNPDYMRPLYTTVFGFFIMGGAVVMLAIGGFLMAKMAKVEI